MKKLLLSMGLMLGALALTNCAKDVAENVEFNTPGKGFSITVATDTRATLNGKAIAWEAGDQIGFGGVAEGSTYTTARLYGFDYVSGNTFSNEKSSFTENNQFYAIFPTALESGKYVEVYTTANGTKVGETKSYFGVGYDGTNKSPIVQNGTSAAHVPAYAPMYWASEGAIAPSALSVTLHHTTALMDFKVVNTEATPITVKSLKLAVPSDTKICGTYYVNVLTGELVSSGASYVYSAATVNVDNAPALAQGESMHIYLPVAPFALEAGDNVTIVVSTVAGGVCTVDKAMTKALTFAAGSYNTATVNFVADAVSDTPWTVSEFAAEIKAGKTSFSGHKVQGIVSAFAPDSNQTLSFGTLLLTDNTGAKGSAVKFYQTANSMVAMEDLEVGDELLIDLSNATWADRDGGIQVTGVTANDVIDTVSYGNDIVPAEVTIAEYLADTSAYDNMCLLFKNIHPAASSIGAKANSTLTFTDGTSELTVYARTQWAAGANLVVDDIVGDLRAFAQYYKAPQVCPYVRADIEVFETPITMSATSLSFDANGGSAGTAPEAKAVTITMKTGYTVGTATANADWLSIIPAGDGSLLISASEYTATYAARNAVVSVPVVKNGTTVLTKSINVKQNAAGAVTAKATYTLTFPDDNSESNKIGNYTSTWTALSGGKSWSITNFNNNQWNNNWTYIKCGRKGTASTATIDTGWAIEEPIDQVKIKVDKVTTSGVDSAKLTVATDSSFNSVVEEVNITLSASEVVVPISNATANCYYRLTFVCNATVTNANGFVQISKLVYTNE